MAKPDKGQITGKITPEEIAADRKANAEQTTRPLPHLEQAMQIIAKEAK
jgi:hypothetical protein